MVSMNKPHGFIFFFFMPVCMGYPTFILFGAHDRYNFGDLLLGRVITALLHNAGVRQDSIVYAGISGINMTGNGGFNIEEIGPAIMNSTVKSLILVHIGGDTVGCSLSCALSMFEIPPADYVNRSGSLHSGCGYILSKTRILQLRPDLSGGLVRSVASTIGGSHGQHHDCVQALNTSTYVSVRDSRTLSRLSSAGLTVELVPDSAVLVSKLFRVPLSARRNNASGDLIRLFNQINSDRYIAVQFRASLSLSSLHILAQQLDILNGLTRIPCVFFLAGSAPGHDSIKAYDTIQQLMKSPCFIFASENTWDAVGLISSATLTVSTSLHVRIVSFSFGVPRLSIDVHPHGKLRWFLHDWDEPLLGPCNVTDVAVRGASLLQEYNPMPTLRKVSKLQRLALRSFRHWFKQIRYLLWITVAKHTPEQTQGATGGVTLTVSDRVGGVQI